MSTPSPSRASTPRVVDVPCLRDNYAYLVVGDGGRALVVDPSEAQPIRDALQREGLTLAGILCTHHHWDHVGGVLELSAEHAGLPVFAHPTDASKIEGNVTAIADDEEVELTGLTVHALHVPGHTLGALAYRIGDALFTGDTLFAAGCGRLFEGDAQTMHASLMRLAKAPDATRLFVGHEYTVANLRFAAWAEPNNQEIAAKLAWALGEREAGRSTMPSSIASERATNPFLRTRSTAEFARLRTAKNTF
jgi:hydroxyacylglutathione hydrolase